MPCYQSTNLPSGVTTTGRTSYTTEADCLNACREGACFEGTSCSVKPQCQCQGTGKTFKGVGTTCESKCNWVFGLPSVVILTLSNCQDLYYGSDFAEMNGSYSLPLQSRIISVDPLSGRDSGNALYQAIRTDERRVYAVIECLDGNVRYKALAGTSRLYDKWEQDRRGPLSYNVYGNFFGSFVESENKCFTTSFSGGNVGYLTCSFEMSCSVNPLS